MNREKITRFNLDDAFKALDDIEYSKSDKVEPNSLHESFKRVDKTEALMEEYYKISNTKDLEDAKEEREDEIAKAKLAKIEKIVDLDAESPEDLQPSYVGKMIIQCPQCMTLFYKDPSDVVHSEDDPDTVNVGEKCQHCGNEEGYSIIGKVGEVTPEEAEQFEEVPEETAEETSAEEPAEELPENEEAAAEEESSEGKEEELPEQEEKPAEEEELTESKNILEEQVKNALAEEAKEETEEPAEEAEKEEEPEEEAKEEGDDESDEKEEGEEELPEVSFSAEEVKEVAANVATEVAPEEDAEVIADKVDEVVDAAVEAKTEEERSEEESAEEETEEETEEEQEELNESAKESDLNKKLKEHNDYIETLQDEIKKEEEAVKVAKNEFIKKLHENNLASLKAALDKAIPEEVKAEEAIDDLPTPEEAAEELPDSKTELTEQLDAKEMPIKEAASEVSDSEIKELLNSEEFNTPISDEEVDRIIEDEKNLKEGKSKSVFEMLEDFDEVSMNSCMTKALTEVYSNVKNFEMTECSLNESSLVVEGKINFNSGKARETSFTFTEGKEPKVLCGINEDLDKNGSFNICYGIDNNKMFVESLKYSYHVEDNLVEGLINR